jgi:hypothetical protein
MNIDRENILKDVYAWFGRVLYAVQLFETELVSLLIVNERLKNSEFTFESLNNLDTLLSKKTLGQLLVEVKKRTDITPAIESQFIEYKDKRNYLVHRYFPVNGEKLITIEGCQELIVELQKLYTDLREADAIATKISSEIQILCGIDEVDFQKYVQEQLEK